MGWPHGDGVRRGRVGVGASTSDFAWRGWRARRGRVGGQHCGWAHAALRHRDGAPRIRHAGRVAEKRHSLQILAFVLSPALRSLRPLEGSCAEVKGSWITDLKFRRGGGGGGEPTREKTGVFAERGISFRAFVCPCTSRIVSLPFYFCVALPVVRLFYDGTGLHDGTAFLRWHGLGVLAESAAFFLPSD